MAHLYIFASIFFGVLSQLIVKWQMNKVGALPEGIFDKVFFLFQLLFTPWIMTSVFLTLLAGLTWMAAMTKFPISYAYPFMSLSFVCVILLGSWLFQESLSVPRLVGTACIMAGIIIAGRG